MLVVVYYGYLPQLINTFFLFFIMVYSLNTVLLLKHWDTTVYGTKIIIIKQFNTFITKSISTEFTTTSNTQLDRNLNKYTLPMPLLLEQK